MKYKSDFFFSEPVSRTGADSPPHWTNDGQIFLDSSAPPAPPKPVPSLQTPDSGSCPEKTRPAHGTRAAAGACEGRASAGPQLRAAPGARPRSCRTPRRFLRGLRRRGCRRRPAGPSSARQAGAEARRGTARHGTSGPGPARQGPARQAALPLRLAAIAAPGPPPAPPGRPALSAAHRRAVPPSAPAGRPRRGKKPAASPSRSARPPPPAIEIQSTERLIGSGPRKYRFGLMCHKSVWSPLPGAPD